MRHPPTRVALFLLAGAGGCGDLSSPARAPALIVAVSGEQVAIVGTPVDFPPAVTVLDDNGEPMAGVEVAFAVVTGGGTLTRPVATTDGAGVAAAGSWTLGAPPGLNSVVATVPTSKDVAVTFVGRGIRIQSVTGGYAHTCALSTDGAAFCWGAHDHYQVGDGGYSMADVTTPVRVASTRAFQIVEAGFSHTCALAAGQPFCWGQNTSGQGGDNTVFDHPGPVAVLAPTTPAVSTPPAGHSAGD
jgi:hypothetical protein